MIFIISCQSEYDKLVKSELATGERHEELLFDFVFDQTRQKFYDQCWEMNRDTIISQGPKNLYAMHMIEPGTYENQDDEIQMLFYGIFDHDKIMHGMDIRYSYPKWSLWNEDYNSDKLIPIIKKYFLKKFPGNDFITIPLKKVDKTTYVKVDRNRQITIYPLDTKELVVKIEDLEFKLSGIPVYEQ